MRSTIGPFGIWRRDMSYMIKLSLVINIVVLIPVCFGLLTSASWAEQSYGAFSPARGILLSVYVSIAIASAILLFVAEPKFVVALLFVQVVYKLTTPFTVGTLNNPVVVSNLFIAAFHSVTIYTVWRAGSIFSSASQA